ncbi:hypothetical protein BKA70DRAFT_1395396 [Coprinopsis sp. MPI-PUGE-AT-0042]|nr:hypothetical protein BKA70DRAFT_1395396 [Coprinopsis sp. MPI-PUGE-AT-0042]
MSAAARAEARRKAILSRGGDRLAKLTTSARGEEGPLLNDPTGIRSTSRNFIGEDSSDMPAPKPFIDNSATPSPQPTRSSLPSHPRSSSSTASSRTAFENGAAPDPSVWSPEQQRQFMQALMGASAAAGGHASQMPAELQTPIVGMGGGDASDPIDPTLPPLDNPLAAMLFPQGFPGAQQGRGASPFGGGAGGSPDGGMGDMGLGPLGALMNMSGGMGGMGGPQGPEPQAEPPTRLQKFLPLVHLVATWSLLAYFVLFFEPRTYAETGGFIEGLLGNKPAFEATVVGLFKVHVVPFFWAFLTLQVTLHSMRIFTKNDTVQPPALLALALPHIPPPFPSIIINSLKYIRMISSFLDDIAILVVGLGLVVYLGSLFS